jgi:membrane fusion protein (multidrug efflux system)
MYPECVSKFKMKALFLLIASLIVMVGCTKQQEEKSESVADIQKRDGVPVRVIKSGFGQMLAYELLGGTAEGYFQSTLNAGIAGKVSDIKGNVGDIVTQNASLMSIEPDGSQNFELTKQQFETAKKSRERILALAEQGGVAQEIIDRVDAEFAAAREGLEAVRKSQFIPAPFEGTIVNIFQTVNNKVSSGDKLLTIAKMDKIRVPLVVSDVLINKFKTGLSAMAIIGTDTINGLIEKVSLSGQDQTHTFIIEAVFNNSRKLLKPSMYVPVKVITNVKPHVISLPLDAIIDDNSKKLVYKIENGVSKRYGVTTGIRVGEVCEVLSGINDGDLVVVSGMSLLADSSKVKIIE